MSNGALAESMTRIQWAGPNNEFTIRVWRQENAQWEINHEELRFIVRTRIEKLPTKSLIAVSILAMDNVNAVEVIDRNGDGLVLYDGWP